MGRQGGRDAGGLSPERLHAVLDALGVGVVAVDGSGRTDLQNAEASRILGLSAATTLGEPLGEVLGATHPLVSLLEEVQKEERERKSPGVAIPDRLGGQPLLVDLSASPIMGPTGAEGAVATLRDRTIARELQAFFDQRLQSELFANLAAGIAHEIRNPLAGIRGSADLLLGKLDEDLRRYPTLIRGETDRLSRLLDDLAELTQDAGLRLAPTNLNRMLDDLLDLHGHDPIWQGIRIVREYDPSLPEVEADPDRLAQVFLNLLRNAAQALHGSGRLTLRTRIETLYHVAAEGGDPVRMVRVEVEDSGAGIAESDLPHVFTPFFSRRQGGTGLGLPLAQHWVVRHGGRIELRSPIAPGGTGTRVRVLLPARRPR